MFSKHPLSEHGEIFTVACTNIVHCKNRSLLSQLIPLEANSSVEGTALFFFNNNLMQPMFYTGGGTAVVYNPFCMGLQLHIGQL